MALLKQTTAYNRAFLLIQSADHLTGLTAASTASIVVQGAKNAGAFTTLTAIVSELGNGYYNAALKTSDTNVLGDLAYHITVASADPTDFVDQIVANILGDTLPASIAGTVTTGTNLDKTGYSLSQAFPANFAALGILAGGQVGIDWGNVANKATVNALAGTTLNSSLSVVTNQNNDKTGYSLAGTVTTGTILDKTGFALTPQERGSIVASTWTTLQTEAYAALHSNPSMAQLLYEMRSMLSEKTVSNTTVTILQIDGATTAEIFTLDSTSPTQIHRAV